MKVKDLIPKTGEWLKGKGPLNEIVISSRIRLARNLAKYPFPEYLDGKTSREVVKSVGEAVGACTHLKKATYFTSDGLTDLDKEILMERHLVSRDFLQSKKVTAVCLSPDEILSIMVNEEDHLRMQVLQSGFSLLGAWHLMDLIDDELSKKLEFSFDSRLGYLTACPTNVGTGLRASCMLHLPALVMTKQINRVIQALSKLTIAVRGLYGEGTQASGNFFQFSNQITLGKSEEQVVLDLEKVVRQIVEHETEARAALMKKKASRLADQIWRSLGLLKAARIISSGETNSLLSLLRLGTDLGITKKITKASLNELFILIQPAHLQMIHGKSLTVSRRDEVRANLVREKLREIQLE